MVQFRWTEGAIRQGRPVLELLYLFADRAADLLATCRREQNPYTDADANPGYEGCHVAQRLILFAIGHSPASVRQV